MISDSIKVMIAVEHTVLHNDDLNAVNTEEDPLNVIPENNGVSHVDNGYLSAILKSMSWNVIRLAKR